MAIIYYDIEVNIIMNATTNEANWIPYQLTPSEKLEEIDKFAPKDPLGDETILIDIDRICTLVDTFQPRVDGLDQKHLKTLKGALRKDPRDVDPIRVIAQEHPGIGTEYIVVDGHHRLEALKALEKTQVHAKVWSGTAREALEWTIRENSKAKLALNPDDKYDTAWRLTQHRKPCGIKPYYKKKQVMDLACVSSGFVDRTRDHWTRLKGTEGLADMSWKQAMAALKRLEMEAQGDVEDRLNDTAQRAANAIPSDVRKLMQNPDMAARILEAASPRTVGRIAPAIIRHCELSEDDLEECRTQLGQGYYDDNDDDMDDIDY